MVRLLDEVEVENTRKKLAWLQAKYDEVRAGKAENEVVKQDTLRSLKGMINQMIEEITWYECHAGQRLDVNSVFRDFVRLLDERFAKGTHTTEESVRYTLFHCLTHKGGIHPSEVVLECPHPTIPGAELDAYVLPADERPGLAFECKFDRNPPNASPDKTGNAGQVFADIFRLALFDLGSVIERFFVYVTDEQMVTYFRNGSNRLGDFFDLSTATLRLDKDYLANRPTTFVKSVGDTLTDCDLRCRLSRDLKSRFSVRIYEVEPIRAAAHPSRAEPSHVVA